MKIHLGSNSKFDKEQSVEFLLSEYAQCFEQMRHYNDTSISLTKFAFTGFIAVASGAFALFKYLEGEIYQNIVIGSVLLLTFVVGVIVLSLMLRNRVYFIVVTRQVNSLRNYFLSNMEMDYLKYNVCYTDPDFPRAFSPRSSYTFLLAIVALTGGILGGVGSYLIITPYWIVEGWESWVIGLVITTFLVMVQLTASFFYLTRYDRTTIANKSLTEESPKEDNNANHKNLGCSTR